jgi:hypothetical protein
MMPGSWLRGAVLPGIASSADAVRPRSAPTSVFLNGVALFPNNIIAVRAKLGSMKNNNHAAVLMLIHRGEWVWRGAGRMKSRFVACDI